MAAADVYPLLSDYPRREEYTFGSDTWKHTTRLAFRELAEPRTDELLAQLRALPRLRRRWKPILLGSVLDYEAVVGDEDPS